MSSLSKALAKQKYAKLYSKTDKSFLNIAFMHHAIMPSSIKSIKTVAYEKKMPEAFLTSTLTLRTFCLQNKVKLTTYEFKLRKEIDVDDLQMRHSIANAMTCQMDVEEILDDLGYIKMNS